MKAITLWQPWASLCVIPRCTRYEENHRIEGGAVSCGFCNRTFTFNFMRDQGPHRCSCRQAVAARAEATRPFKTIETRSWKAPDSLIGQRIAIHAAKRPVDVGVRIGQFETMAWSDHDRSGVVARGFGLWDWSTCAPGDGIGSLDEPLNLPLGAVVGTAVLADCVPMVHTTQPRNGHCLVVSPNVMMLHSDPRSVAADVSDQRPFGLFEPGRWAWLLTDAVRFDEPIPATGRQGIWNWEQA